MIDNKGDDFAIAWIKLSFLSSGLFCKQGKQLLSGLNGQINFHTLTALMGPSGAGKTTLLKCINMRTKEGLTADSKIYVNQNIPLRTCFIMQESRDHILMGLTIRESLLFASKIKNLLSTSVKYRDSCSQTGNSLLGLDSDEENPEKINKLTQIDINDKFDHKSNVERILKELLLTDCAENSVNDCSGGELRRLSVGLELVSKLMPNLLCIDEPTSGLDSNAAELVIQCLSQLSKCHRMAIVTSIHQPNSLLLNMFDQLYVLSKGGYCVFSGRPNILRQHLIDCQINCTKDVLPIELLLKISSEYPKNKHYLNENTKVFINNNVNNIDDSLNEIEIQPDQKRITNDNEIDRLIKNTNNNFVNIFDECKINGKLISNRVDMQTKTFSLYHFYYLFLRGFTFFVRHQWKADTFLAVFCILFAFVLILFYGTDIGEESGCLSLAAFNSNASNVISGEVLKQLSVDSKLMLNTKFLFLSAIVIQSLSVSATVLTIPQEIKIFTNEHQNRWYSTSSYFWSKLILEILPTVVISLIYSIVVYFGTGQLNESHRFFYFVVLMFLAIFVAKSIGLLIGIIFPNNYPVAITTSVAQNLFFILLGGFLLPQNIQHPIIRGLSYTSIYNLIFSSVMSLIYGQDRCQYPNIPILLHHLKIDPDSRWTKAWYILGHLIIIPILAQIVLTIKVNNFSLSTIIKLNPKFKSKENKNVTIDPLNNRNSQ